jgi:phosphoserine phosphatase RsbU/P
MRQSRRALWLQQSFVAGFAVVSLIGALDAMSSTSFLGLLMLGPFVAALGAPPKKVLLVGGYAVAWAVVLGFGGDHWSLEHWARIGVNTAGTGVAVTAAQVRERYAGALVRATDVAEAAQRALLRPLVDRYDDVEMAVRYVSAAEGALVGGDVYDAEVTPWGLRVLVGDVCGHGLSAVERASTLVFSFREAANSCETLEEIAACLETSMVRHQRSGSMTFATGLLIQVQDGAVEIANCGHPDPLVVGGRQVRPQEPVARSRPFGLGASPAPTRLVLLAGEQLVTYTDGLSEARDERGRFFDLEAHVAAAFAAGPLGAAIDQLLDRVREHVPGTLRDDVVVLAMRPR